MDNIQIPVTAPAKALNKKALILIIAAIVLVALLVGGYFYWKRSQPVEQTVFTGEIAQPDLPAINPTANPYEKIGETNPLEQTNPFKDIKTNPFK